MLALTGDGGKKVMNEYFLDNDILYSQPAYMDLFKETFTDYFCKENSSRRSLCMLSLQVMTILFLTLKR